MVFSKTTEAEEAEASHSSVGRGNLAHEASR